MKHLKTFFNIHKILAILILSLVFYFFNSIDYQRLIPNPRTMSYTTSWR